MTIGEKYSGLTFIIRVVEAAKFVARQVFMDKGLGLKKLLLSCVLLFSMPGLTLAGEALPEWLSLRNARVGKLLVTTKKIPTTIDYEMIGPVEVRGEWFGSEAAARQMLAAKGREMGANAVVQAVFGQITVFPRPAAPQAHGIAVRIPDIWALERLADKAESWE